MFVAPVRRGCFDSSCVGGHLNGVHRAYGVYGVDLPSSIGMCYERTRNHSK